MPVTSARGELRSGTAPAVGPPGSAPVTETSGTWPRASAKAPETGSKAGLTSRPLRSGSTLKGPAGPKGVRSRRSGSIREGPERPDRIVVADVALDLVLDVVRDVGDRGGGKRLLDPVLAGLNCPASVIERNCRKLRKSSGAIVEYLEASSTLFYIGFCEIASNPAAHEVLWGRS